jgi:excisionase family DNA binding protein
MIVHTRIDDPNRDHYVTTQEAAQLLGVSLREVYNLIDQGLLTPKRAGRRPMLRLSELEPWIGSK